jgi:hypothetical protein
MKLLATYAYDAFCSMQGIKWNRPAYRQNEISVFCSEEKDLDLLISHSRKKLATFIMTLKATYADPSEIIRCEWSDLHGNVLSINHPVKGHNAGNCELYPQLVAMINSLPKLRKTILATSYTTVYASFHNLRSKAAVEFQNPELLKIKLTSFRDWGGTKTAIESNGNPLVIMRALRHKKFESSRKYIDAVAYYIQHSDFDATVATSPEEILQLGKEGWTKYDETIFGGIRMHFYRRSKRFTGVKSLEDKGEKVVDRAISSLDQ